MISIALYNLKGGVGKTTSAVNLAYLASADKKRTVLWDWDPQSAASWYFGVDKPETKALKIISQGVPIGYMQKSTPFPKLSVIPADLSLRKTDIELHGINGARRLVQKLIDPLSEDTSILIFDCPPMMSPSMDYVLSSVDLVLVPMVPSPLSVRAMEQVVAYFNKKKKSPARIMGFFNMVDQRRTLHKQTIASANSFPFEVLDTLIPMDSAAEKMTELRQPLTFHSENARSSIAYREMWHEIKERLSKARK